MPRLQHHGELVHLGFDSSKNTLVTGGFSAPARYAWAGRWRRNAQEVTAVACGLAATLAEARLKFAIPDYHFGGGDLLVSDALVR
jgi:hypothetical protein